LRVRGILATALNTASFAIVCLAGASLSFMAQSAMAQTQPPASDENAPVALAQDNIAKYQGLTVEAIRLPNISSLTDQARTRRLIAQKENAPLERDLIRQSLHQLFDSGRFADVRIEGEPTEKGNVVLDIYTTPNYFVGQIRIESPLRRPTAGQVANASRLNLGDLFTPDQMDRALENILRLMEENGYYHSTVTPEQNRDETTQQISILFRITPGLQARVGKVTANCDPGCSAQEIEKVAKLRPGDPVSLQRVSNALERLRKQYQKRNRLLAQVSVSDKTYRADANAVDYVLNIVPGPSVVILAEGFKIKRNVLKQNVPVFEENAVDEDLISEGRRNLLYYLQTKGYFDAKISMKETHPSENQLQITYVITPGVRRKLDEVKITGNHYFPGEELRSRMQVQPAGKLSHIGRYSEALLTADVRTLENVYRANGFEQVKITTSLVEDFAGRENEIAITLTVAEGPQTLIGAFSMVGNHAFPEAKLRAGVIQTAVGQPFSEVYIAEDRDNLLNYYFNHGFPHATFEASAKPIPGEENRMEVSFTINEGEQVFVDQVLVSGLQHTKPYIVQRELQVKAGDPVSQIDMLQSQQRLYDLGIFSQVDTAVQNPNGNLPQKNVVVDLQEAKRYTFTYGFGFEFQTGLPNAIGTNQALGYTGVSPRGSLDITRLNFLGRDHTITLKADVGSLEQRGRISYVAPRLLGSPRWKLSFIAFYDNTLDITTFTSQRLEGSVQTEQIINKTSSMTYSFNYRRVKASNIEISPDLIPLLSLPTRVGEPELNYVRNTRDNDLESTKGSYITGNVGVASGYFGSQADFSRILIGHTTYYAFGKNRRPEKKFVLARSTRVGLQNAFGNTTILPPGHACPPNDPDCATIIPLAERFLSGGGNSLRGFGLNQAGPRDPVTGFPLGGSALFINNLELRFPPTPLPYFKENISFAVFEDAGNVFTDGETMLDNLLRWRQKNPAACLQEATAGQCDFSYVSHAVGIGVRYKTPIGPVRFDFGYNLNPPAFPSCEATPSRTGQSTSTYCVNNTVGANGTSTLPFFVPQHSSHFNVYFSIGQSF
jgi:outer membrane protein insertion porin family